MHRYSVQIAVVLSLTEVLVIGRSEPIVGIHGIIGCDIENLNPLLQAIHQVVGLITVVGVVVAVGALAYAGVVMMWSGEDAMWRAIKRVQRVLMGVGILVSAPYVVAFVIAPLSICGGVS